MCLAHYYTEPRGKTFHCLGGGKEEGRDSAPSMCNWTELDSDPVCTPTDTHTKDSLVSRSPTKTENLSTGVLDKAMGTCWGRARRAQTLLPRAFGAVKAISAYQDSICCLHEVRLQLKAVSGTDNCPGTPMLRRDPKLLLQPMLTVWLPPRLCQEPSSQE